MDSKATQATPALDAASKVWSTSASDSISKVWSTQASVSPFNNFCVSFHKNPANVMDELEKPNDPKFTSKHMAAAAAAKAMRKVRTNQAY